MKGKRVLVTGASSGIGFRVAADFLAKGAVVGAHFRSNKDGARGLLEIGDDDQCRLFQADFCQTEQVNRLWNEYLAWSGGIDILINNAGDAPVATPLTDLTDEAWDAAFQVNAKAPFLLSRNALEVMSRQGYGKIVNISSIGIKFGGGLNTIHYSASKAALEAVTMSFAKAGAPHNVLVNAVRAGVTDTPLHQKIGRTDMLERSQMIPLKRLAQPNEISQAILFLASEESSYITGTIMTVAGGE